MVKNALKNAAVSTLIFMLVINIFDYLISSKTDIMGNFKTAIIFGFLMFGWYYLKNKYKK